VTMSRSIGCIASTMFWPCETRTSTCRSFATISSGLYRFLAIAVLLDVKVIPQVGPLQWGSIMIGGRSRCLYRVPEIVTRGRFPDGGESDSTWRTQEARHVGSDTIAPGF